MTKLRNYVTSKKRHTIKAHNKTQRILTKLVIKEESTPQKLVKVNGSKVPQCRKQFANHYESNFEMKCNVQKER